MLRLQGQGALLIDPTQCCQRGPLQRGLLLRRYFNASLARLPARERFRNSLGEGGNGLTTLTRQANFPRKGSQRFTQYIDRRQKRPAPLTQQK